MTDRHSYSQIPLQPFYGPDDVPVAPADLGAHLGAPGEFPYTRGRRAVDPTAGWIHRELSGEGSPARSNEQFRMLIAAGAGGVDVIGDTPTAAHLDPDHPLAVPAVGAAGVSICRLQDFIELYEGIPLDQLTLSHSLPGAFGIAGLFLAAQHHGVDPAVLRGSFVQAPMFVEDCGYATHLPFDLRLRLTLDSIQFATREMPRFHPYLEDTYYIADAGLDSVEEMALGFIEIREVVRRLTERGLAVDAFAPRIAILVDCRMDVFEEIAKIRATRRLYARMMRDEFGATDPRAMSINVAVHTSGLTLTAAQPINNVVRGTVQALAMAMAGVQALEISTFDEAYRTPSHAAHLVALRTQQIVAEESGAGRVADPLGGSWYVESLTDEIESRIETMITDLESRGPVAESLADGVFRTIIASAMDRHTRAVQDGTLPVVGVNRHRMPPEEDTLLREVAEERFEPAHDHVARIRAWKAQRDERALGAALDALRAAGADHDGPHGADLMGPVIAAFQAEATHGEMTAALREGYGLEAEPRRVA